jgi:hypothetical protein
MVKRFQARVVLLAAIGATSSVLAQPADAVRNAARGEGVVRFAVAICFVSDSTEQSRLNAQSSRYIRSLSSASGLPVAELEGLAASGLANAKSSKKLSPEQCKKGRQATVKLLNERDMALGK